MRRMISVSLILAAAAALSFLPVQDCLAYGPGDSWYYDHYRRGGPGVEYDYEMCIRDRCVSFTASTGPCFGICRLKSRI